MPVDDGASPPLLDVAVHLLGHLLALEVDVGAVEVLGVNPRDRFTVDLHVVEEEQVGRADGPAVLLGLLLDHLRLAAQAHALVLEPIGQDLLEEVRGFGGFALVDVGDAVRGFCGFELFALALLEALWILEGLLDLRLAPALFGQHRPEDVHRWEVKALGQLNDGDALVVGRTQVTAAGLHLVVGIHGLLLQQGAAQRQGLLEGHRLALEVGGDLLDALIGQPAKLALAHHQASSLLFGGQRHGRQGPLEGKATGLVHVLGKAHHGLVSVKAPFRLGVRVRDRVG